MSWPLRKERMPEPNDPLNELQRRRTSRPIETEDEQERIALAKSSNQNIVENNDIIDGDDITDDAFGNNPSGSPQAQNARPGPQIATSADTTPLFSGNELQQLQSRWDKIQTDFVDQPRNAVREADSLVSSAMQRLSEVFSTERSKLEQQWDRGDSVSTEDLRIALQRYRSFFRRVLAL